MINLNTCTAGDKLLSVHDTVLVYIRKNDGASYPHEVMYPDGSFGSRTDDGKVFNTNRKATDHDIVAVLPRYTQIAKWDNPADKLKDINILDNHQHI